MGFYIRLLYITSFPCLCSGPYAIKLFLLSTLSSMSGTLKTGDKIRQLHDLISAK